MPSISASAGASLAAGAAVSSANAKVPAAASGGPANRDLLFAGSFFEIKVPALGVLVGFFTEVSGMNAQVDVLEYPEGGRNDMIHKLPSRIKQGNITLKRGMTREPALLAWLKKSVVKAEPTNMSLTLMDTKGQKVQAWSFAQAYPVKWTASDPKATATEIMTETLEIAHSGITSA